MTEMIATGLRLPEGPVLLSDGRVAVVEQMRGQVSVWDGSRIEALASGDGAWNSITLGSDGHLYAAQNGGGVNDGWRAARLATPGIERITLDGEVHTVRTTFGGVPAIAPNDLAFGPDGRLYFTDPAHGYAPGSPGTAGRLFAVGPDDDGELLLQLDVCYCNGIGFLADGTLVWVESYGRFVCRLDEDGRRRVICQLPDGHVPDGFAVATDDRLFVATVSSGGVTVVSPDGRVLDHLRCGDRSLTTNCCFVGSDLVVTDFGPDHERDPDGGCLWNVPTDATGVALHRGSLS
jgi:gluconolactonase